MIQSVLSDSLEEVDIIIVGGGTAGLVIAARLSDADPQAMILVIEGGSDNYHVPTIVHPALYRANFAQNNASLAYVSAKEENVANRSIVVAAGGVLGGGSSVNGAIYARPQQVDYDSWGVKGWSTEELIPFLKKASFETFKAPTSSDTHGYDGPVMVSDGLYNCAPLRDDFISAMEQNGCSAVEDLQDLTSNNAVSTAHRFVSADTGERQDTAHTYLHSRLQGEEKNNLHVLCQTQVIRILFDDDKRASGVEVRANPVFGADNSASTRIKARKLVIVSAGALGTPQILERSGVGNADVLSRAGVPVVADVPGVGNDYQDHHMVLVTYKSTLTPEQSVDSVINGALDNNRLLATNANIMSWNGVDASSKIRPSKEEVNGFKPELRAVWDSSFADVPNRPLGSLVLVAGVLGNPAAYPSGSQYFTMGCYSTYPRSRGHVHITGPEIEDPLHFETGFLSDHEGSDIQVLAWLYKKQREVASRMKCQLGPVTPEPRFAGTLAMQDDKLQYSSEDDLAIEQWARENINTAYHPMGTCKMAPSENNGVVDRSLSVHGIKGLKIADMSIVPENVSANTMSTALLIGEKAADIFIKELGWENK